MRVLVVTNMYPTVQDPAWGTFVYEQVQGLRKRGLDIDVMLVNGRDSKHNYLFGYGRYWSRLLSKSYDLVHAHYVFSGMIALAQVGLPVVVSFHGGPETAGMQGLICRSLAPFFAAVTVTSPVHHRAIGYQPAQIIPCGVDTNLFRPADQQIARRRLGLETNKKYVLYCGAIRPEKRFDLAQQSVEHLKQRRCEVELIVATGIDHGEVPNWMNAADAMILPSDCEGSPVAVKEAMATNLPIVATDVGDVAERFGNLSGYYLVSQNIAEMAAALEAAIDHGPTKARESISSISLKRTVDDLITIYRDVSQPNSTTPQRPDAFNSGKEFRYE